jgi:dihydroorotase
MTAPQRLTIRRPDDWHLHLRTGAMLQAVLPFSAAQMGRAIVMPNLVPPVTDTARARTYRDEIAAAAAACGRPGFAPLMTCYLTDDTDPDEVERGHRDGLFAAVKLYPAHATTNSAAGVTDLKRVRPVLERMEKIGLPLLVHGEVTDPAIDIFDREAVFLDRVLTPLLADMPGLRVVLEHATTEEAVAFVRQHGPGGRLGCTITAHHLMINRSMIFAGGIRPHLFCLPVAKSERHRLALRRAATSGEPWFFLGTDSAPHTVTAKQSGCGSAGIFTAPAAIELYAQVFDEEGALDRLEGFASLHGPAFHGLPPNAETITLERSGMTVADLVTVGTTDAVLPFRAGERLDWRVAG